MKNSIKTELLEHINESQKDGLTTHHEMFNEDYYIIGYYQSSQWLKEHGLGELEAVNICKDFEREHFGEIEDYPDIIGYYRSIEWLKKHGLGREAMRLRYRGTDFDTETLVNHLVYWYGLELCNELNID
tara:strand:+ start:403 stop:789 length:387 start_codon:yes stop_codon:yes gene_type:complete